MSDVEKVTAETAAGGSPDRGLVLRRSRSLLFGLVATTVGGGVAGFSAALLFGVQAGFSQPLATFLAGAGAVSAGLLAYLNGQHSRAQTEAHHKADMERERERHQEDSRHTKESALRDRYTAITAQIADDSAAIRQAGVYALTALADDWHAFGEDDERQVCINLLQWYLRVPFPEGNDPEKPDLSEREIRQTIVSILAQRRSRSADDPKSWKYTDISLHQVSLPNCHLVQFNLTGIHLYRANLSRADLSAANLADAKLTGANLTGAMLVITKMTDAMLARANLTTAEMYGVFLNGADLSGANLADARLLKADLIEADLTSAKLVGANLVGANLTGAKLVGANLTSADLTSANLTAANLTNAKLVDARLSRVTYNEFTQWPEGFTPPQPDA
ncbi:pentapeptide repeat-containing protein [Nocardia sp. NBC_00565]|uniref:pentapeptide repeat-containing protein n=1 Tax=Nocardia sp. NBC_00565 TaxID=2975993 RepID=UPI002E800C57|nr:pentapeptide repeat-containing protein [Nocardia sp. NBC_00565]WUC02392.1 pentapeptide repeat-containing protein [Nocardia sp. NBC_00565]